MADKNYIKALRRAKAKKTYYTSIITFVPIGLMLFILNVSVIAPNAPWCLIPIAIFSVLLVVQKVMISRRPQRTILSKDYLEYQTEKELRMIEFEDDMDELEAESLKLGSLELQPLHKDLDEGLV